MVEKTGINGVVRRTIIAVLVVFVGWLFATGGGTWRGAVNVMEAELHSGDRLLLVVQGCEQRPKLSQLHESEERVEVEVVSYFTLIKGGGTDCLDAVEVLLQEPLGDRDLVDLDSGRLVDVQDIRTPSG